MPAVSDDECASTASVSASSVSASAPARADTTVLIVTADGRLYAHGRNAFGQLGMGDTRDCTDFEEVTALRPLCVQPGVLACGSFHSVFGAALELPGMHVATTYSPCDLYSMGWSRDGQLGREVSGNGIRDQDEASPLIPAPMDVTDDDNDDEALSSISHLSCGSRHTAFIDMRGRLYTCGWNAYGQLGQGRQADGDLQFARVAPPSNGSRFIAVACGAFATVAVILNK